MKIFIRNLIREALITEISIADAWTQFYSNKEKFPLLNGDVELFKKLNDLYPKNGSNFNKGYFTWIYNLLKDGKLKEEDFYKVKEYLGIFAKFFNKLPKENRDINKFKSLSDLYAVIKPFEHKDDSEPTSKTSELKKIKEEEITKVFENDDWLVMIPKTERASCLIGKGTKWCTAADKSNNMFNHYSKNGPLYVIVNKNARVGDEKKYQLHFETNSFMNEDDREVPASYFFDHIAEGDSSLFEFFQGASDKFWDFILETSVDDIADGVYSETFNRALDASEHDGVSPYVKTDVLKKLRNSSEPDTKYTGFIYEDNPDEIHKWDIESLLESDMEQDLLYRVLEHLTDINFDEEGEIQMITVFKNAKNGLSEHKLELNRVYDIDKGKKLKINRIDFKNEDNPFNVTIDKKNGNMNLETLVNLIHQGQLFDEHIEIVKKLISL